MRKEIQVLEDLLEVISHQRKIKGYSVAEKQYMNILDNMMNYDIPRSEAYCMKYINLMR